MRILFPLVFAYPRILGLLALVEADAHLAALQKDMRRLRRGI
jgi:hypothetical protein